MNKYQEALDNVHAEWGTSDRDIDILQELVDRSTPIKPIKDSHSISACSNCGRIFLNGKPNYCSECGQALDWSKIHDKQEL